VIISNKRTPAVAAAAARPMMPKISSPRKMLNLARHFSDIPENSRKCKHRPVSVRVTVMLIVLIFVLVGALLFGRWPQ
jgi:hypothetical protein